MLVTALERKHNQIRQEGRQESELIGEIRATQKFLKHPVMSMDELARKSRYELQHMLQQLETELATFN